MNAERYDLIVLGSGSAARAGAGKAAQEHGARVALIEHWLWGGSCPNVACRPTKAYVVAAELMHDVRRHAAERGIDLPEPAIRLAQTRRWKDALRRDQQSWVQTLKEAGYAVVPGTAAFVDTQTVRVGEQELSGDRILVATGSRTAIPPILSPAKEVFAQLEPQKIAAVTEEVRIGPPCEVMSGEPPALPPWPFA